MKPIKIILAHFLYIIFTANVHPHSVNIHPKRATGIVGGEVHINCEVEFGPNNEMTWDFNNVFVYIKSGGEEYYPQGNSKYSVQITGMNFALTVKDLRLEDGGEYMCTSFTSEATAFLVVLDTPSITLNPPAPVDGETAKVTCEARFGGPKKDLILPDHHPNLKMYLRDSLLNDMVIANDTSDAKKHYLISMTKNLTVHAGMNSRHITCEIGTAEPSVKRSSVAILNVLYSVRDIYITPDQERYKVGETISCIADGNPAAVYEWSNVQGTPIYGKWLMITESMIGENNWECVARNFINGEWFEKSRQRSFVTDSSAVTIAFDPPKSDSSSVIISVLTVIIAILVFIAAVSFYFLWKKLKKPKGSSTNGNANYPQELGSVEAEKLLPTIQQEKYGSGAAEHSIEPNIQQGKDGSDSSEHLIEVKIQEHNLEVTTPLQQNIPKGNNGSGLSENSIKVTNKEEQSDVTKLLQPTIQQEKHSIQPTIQQEKEISSAPEHSIQVEKPKPPPRGSSRCITLLRSVQNIQNKQELDRHGKEILRVLKEDGKSIVKKEPNILIGLIKKADKLIDSEYYEYIIKAAPHGSEDSPLKYLLDELKKEVTLRKLLENQNKLLSVIKIIASYGDVQYRSECLQYIIFTRTFSSGIEYRFEWSEEYLSTLKNLIDKGADPTWIPTDKMNVERKKRSTAQTEFFGKIFVILWEKNKLYESILLLLPLMLSKKCTNNEFLRGTLLHEFVGAHWNYITANLEYMPSNFFCQFKSILREILRHDKTLLVQKDWFGRIPLQHFLKGITLDESIFGDVREIIQLLQSPEVLSFEDKNGHTALHYLAKGFPVIRGPVTQSGLESFLELVKNLSSESNVGCQDINGQTALHLLALKFPSGISEQSGEVYLNFIKHLATYNILEKNDIRGRTALHILAFNFIFEIPHCAMETFVKVIKCIAVPKIVGIRNKKNLTALQIIYSKSGNEVPEHYIDTFQEIMNILGF